MAINSKDYASAWGLDENNHDDENNNIPAFFNLEDLDDDEAVGDWVENAVTILRTQSTDFVKKAVENLMFYKGVPGSQTSQYYNIEDANRYTRNNKVSLNIIYEYVEFWVNRIAQYKANISAVPTNNDPKARDSAEAKELALKDYLEKNKIDEKLNEFSRESFTFGEAFLHCHWDYDKGDLDPNFEKIEKKYKQFERTQTESGHEVNINRLPRVGDIATDIVPSIYVLYEERPWAHVEYLILDIKTNADKLRSDYPEKDIRGDGDISCYWMYHLPTKYLPKGRFVKKAGGVVLENIDYPYDKPIFPLVKLTDIDVTGMSRGKSFVENIKPHQVLINETITTTWNNLRRSAKGKWVYVNKTVNPKHLSPESPGIGYVGGVPPRFEAFPGIKQEAISFIELLVTYAEKQARVHGVSQGTPPPNVRSGLQFAQLEEQQRKAVEITISKKNNAIEELCNVLIMLMVKHYRDDDGRTLTIFGKDKEYLTKALKLDALKEDHAIRVKNDDALPTGKASQLNFFGEIHDRWGEGVVPKEMIIDMLDSGRFNQYTDYAGATVETTTAQIGLILNEVEPGAPEEHEDLLLKWQILVGFMRKRSYLSYNDGIKDKFKEFVLAVETMVIEKEIQPPALQEQLATLKNFPIYYKPPKAQYADEQALAPLPPEAMPPGEAVIGPEGVPSEEIPLEEPPIAPPVA